jgi:hypothetical protein
MSACLREPEVTTMLLRGHWPHACEAELRNHIHTCAHCRQQVLLAQTFQNARNQAIGAATIPQPGVLWWKAQLLRRNQALRHVGRPVTTAQVFALVISVAATATILIRQSTGSDWLAWLSAPYNTLHIDAVSLFTSTRASLTADLNSAILVAAAGTLLILAAVVAYLASDHQ